MRDTISPCCGRPSSESSTPPGSTCTLRRRVMRPVSPKGIATCRLCWPTTYHPTWASASEHPKAITPQGGHSLPFGRTSTALHSPLTPATSFPLYLFLSTWGNDSATHFDFRHKYFGCFGLRLCNVFPVVLSLPARLGKLCLRT